MNESVEKDGENRKPKIALNFKIDIDKVDREPMNSDVNPSQSLSARSRVKTPRNAMMNPMLSPRKDTFTSPREEISKFLHKREDLQQLVSNPDEPLLLDQTEDEMLLTMKNQDVRSPILREYTKNKRRSLGVPRESHFHQLNPN